MIKLIIFDWDDVFTLGSTNGYFACYHETLKQLGVTLSADDEQKRIRAKWGKTARDELSELLQEHPELLDEAVQKYESILLGNTFVDCLTIVEGSQQLIKNLAKKYRLTIASGVNPQLLKEKIFRKFSIPNVFREILTVYDLEDSTKAKPHPYLIQEIMRRQNIKPNETIMVGDAKGDMQMAKDARVLSVAVLTGHLTREEAEDLGIKHIIPDVTQLEKVLKKL